MDLPASGLNKRWGGGMVNVQRRFENQTKMDPSEDNIPTASKTNKAYCTENIPTQSRVIDKSTYIASPTSNKICQREKPLQHVRRVSNGIIRHLGQSSGIKIESIDGTPKTILAQLVSRRKLQIQRELAHTHTYTHTIVHSASIISVRKIFQY